MTVRARFWTTHRIPGFLALLLALTVVAGCSAGDGLGPGGRITASDTELANISAALLDARDRIAPELHTAEIIPTLQNRLSMCSENLLARRYQGTVQAVSDARKILNDSEAAAPPEDAADRAAIHLALDQVVLLLTR